MAMTKLTAVRHAKVAVDGLCYGRSVVPLTRNAAGAAARMIRAGGPKLDSIWSSPAPRCAEPAALWAIAVDTLHHIDARLWELAYGDWDGVLWDDIPRESLDYWAEDWIHRAPPHGESAKDVESRVRAWVSALPHGHHGLSAHAGVIKALHVVVRGLAWEDAMRCATPHLEPIEFSW